MLRQVALVCCIELLCLCVVIAYAQEFPSRRVVHADVILARVAFGDGQVARVARAEGEAYRVVKLATMTSGVG